MLASMNNEWGRAVLLSCAVHFGVMILLGFAGLNVPQRATEEVFIKINMSEPEMLSDDLSSTAPAAAPVTAAQTYAAKHSAPVTAAVTAAVPAANPVGSVTPAQSLIADSAGAVSGDIVSAAAAEGGGAVAGEAGGAVTGQEGYGEVAGSGRGGVDINAIGSAFAAKVDSCKEYPYMAMRRGQTGIVTVFVRLDAGGSLVAVEISESSGVGSLDESALTAVRRACPFTHGAGRTVEFIVPISYELRG